MAKNIDFMGAIFPDVPSVKLPQQGGGLVSFDDTTDANATASDIAQGKTAYVNGAKVTGTAQGGSANIEALSVTQNGTYTASGGVDGYSPVTVNVSGGGGGIGTLVATKSLGNISTASTTATNLNQTVSFNDAFDYDLLIVHTSVDSVVNNRHASTTALVYLTAGNKIGTKNGYTIVNAKLNMKADSTGVVTSRSNTSAYGIYPDSAGLSATGTCEIYMYSRYNSTQTGTINNSYTTRVYGVNLYDLIGG